MLGKYLKNYLIGGNMQLTSKKSIIGIAALIAIVALFFFTTDTFASGAKDLKGIATNLSENVRSMANLITLVAYVAGIGFLLAGVVQFKAHKDNPIQVPLSKPLVYIGVGAFLVFLPHLINTAGETVYGGSQQGRSGAEADISNSTN